MNGILVVNNFLESGKFNEIYGILRDAFAEKGAALDIVKSGDLPHSVLALSGVKSDRNTGVDSDETPRLSSDGTSCINLDGKPGRRHCEGSGIAERYDFGIFWDKDYVLAKELEYAGLRLFNSADAVLRCDNKAYTAMELEKAGIDTPETYVAPITFEGVGYCNTDFLDAAAARIGYPMILKELYGSFGQQVCLVRDREEALAAIGKLDAKGFLMQRYVKAFAGRDIRVNVVGDRAVASMIRYSVSGDFRSNITNGGRALAYTISPAIENAAVAAVKALGLDFAGVDILLEDGRPLVCEVNSNPHFKSTFDATGINVADHIAEYVTAKVGAGRINASREN